MSGVDVTAHLGTDHSRQMDVSYTHYMLEPQGEVYIVRNNSPDHAAQVVVRRGALVIPLTNSHVGASDESLLNFLGCTIQERSDCA